MATTTKSTNTRLPATRPQGQRLTRVQRRAAQEAFLKAFRLMGNVRAACQQAQISRQTVYVWLDTDEAFKARYEEAEEDAVEYMEAKAWDRAINGVKRPAISRGEVVYEIDDKGNKKMVMVEEPSDALMMFLLKARKPQKYRERLPSIEVNNNVIVTEHKDRLLEKLRALPAPTSPDIVDGESVEVPTEDTGNDKVSEEHSKGGEDNG